MKIDDQNHIPITDITQIPKTLSPQTSDIIQTYAQSALLSELQIKILYTELNAIFSESNRVLTAKQIAKLCQCSVQTVRNCHWHPRYMAVKDRLLDVLIRGKADFFLSQLIKAAEAGKVAAIKLGLEITNKHIDRLRTETINVNADISLETLDVDQAIDRFLIMLGERGYTIEYVNDRWRALKAQQAF